MTELIKAGDLSSRYGVSTRTLRYYEEIGLMQSRRIEEYAYRMYDEAAVKRLEQILILRKLGIGIKDIRRVFSAPGTQAVLEVLGEKVDDIDEEVSLLQELKGIVLEFIRQIRDADFSRDSDVKLLYEKARDIEAQLANADYAGNPSPAHRLFEVAGKLEVKAVSRLQIPENVLKRLLQNVYFILGDGVAVADELGRRYGMCVYHTCEYRRKHSENADPQFQPGLCRFQENIPLSDFFARDPEETRQIERDVVHDFTPMVIMDLIQLSAKHEKIICENDIDIESILHLVTHSVLITNYRAWDNFIEGYENAIRRRDISDDKKEELIRKLNEAWGKGKPESPRGATPYGIKQIFLDEHSTVEQTADEIAKYFGLN